MKIVAKLFTALSTSDLPFTDVEKVKEDRKKKLEEGPAVILLLLLIINSNEKELLYWRCYIIAGGISSIKVV